MAVLRSPKTRWLAYSFSLSLALGMVLLFLTVEVSSEPEFCGTCHVMEPYFDSWKHSSHRDVSCVDCHIPPGVAHEVRKKWEALSMVASYFTGTYGTNPWAEIDDAACLQCHQRRLLSSREVFGSVLFDHEPHLTELRRGKKLRCTSCHSQIVQGSHISVTSTTCILCHFKGEEAGLDTRRCSLCHTVPDKVISKGLLTFDHADVGRFDMPCESCHPQEASGTQGRVPRERCFTCHNDPPRLNRYDETEMLHRTHVSEHKVDCMHCHLEIEHVVARHAPLHESEGQCSRCHSSGHGQQYLIYAGIGGRGLEPMPAPMYLAGVACEGCHIQLADLQQESPRGTEISCMSCHGPRYRPTYFRWKETMAGRTAAFERRLRQTEALFRGEPPEQLVDARHNLELLQVGNGVHNFRYALALLSKSNQMVNEARAQVGRRALAVPWPEIPYQSECAQCHQGIEMESGRVFGKSFSHLKHVVENRIDCEKCHRTHDEKPAGEILRFGTAGCSNCHHSESSKDCISCHSDISERVVVSFRGEFSHAIHLELGADCDACHTARAGKSFLLDRDMCSGCH